MSILLLFPGFIIAFAILFYYEYKIRQIRRKEPKNKVYFYVARDKGGTLWLYLGKPHRHYNIFCTDLDSSFILTCHSFYRLGLNMHDFDNLKWEDEPVEVFINMED